MFEENMGRGLLLKRILNDSPLAMCLGHLKLDAHTLASGKKKSFIPSLQALRLPADYYSILVNFLSKHVASLVFQAGHLELTII